MTTLKCKECGYENESNRVYCHQCGAKLDRSLLPAGKQETVADKKKLKKLDGVPNASRLKGVLCRLKLVLWALVAAMIIQVVRPPEGTPLDQASADPGAIVTEFKKMLSAPEPQRITVEESLANGYLAGVIGGVTSGPLAEYIRFQRAFANFEEGACRVSMQYSFFKKPLYFGALYKLQIKGSQLETECIGGNFGRLALHPLLMKLCGRMMDPLWENLGTERRMLQSVTSLEVHKGKLLLISKGTAAH